MNGLRHVLLAAVAVAVVCVAPVVTASLRAEEEFAAAAQFSAFKQQYGKAYATLEEEAHRLRVFKENMEDAKVQNAANPYATFGVTQFSDLTREEFKKYYLNGRMNSETVRRNAAPSANVTRGRPTYSVDWRDRGAVTPVKNQGRCYACWAFAVIGAIESQTKIIDGALKVLSEQHLVSCDTTSDGCKGGLGFFAAGFIIRKNNGVVYTEESYPYVSDNGKVPACDTNNRVAGAKIARYEIVPSDEDQMALALIDKGPIFVSVDASTFHQYKGGVMTKCSTVRTDHEVVLVGVNENFDPPYWIVKNSWGKTWGENGYMRLKKGVNLCLINQYPLGIRLATQPK